MQAVNNEEQVQGLAVDAVKDAADSKVCSLASSWQTALKLSDLIALLANCNCFTRPSLDIASFTVRSRVDEKFANFEHLDIMLEQSIVDLKDPIVLPTGSTRGFSLLYNFFRAAFIAAKGIYFMA